MKNCGLRLTLSRFPRIKVLSRTTVISAISGKIRGLVFRLTAGHLIKWIKIKRWLAKNDKRYLQIGGGRHVIASPYWINGDIIAGDIYIDATKSLPFPDNSIDAVFTEQFLEHLSQTAGSDFIAEVFRILKPEGRLRQSTPDLARVLQVYTDRNSYAKKSEVVERHMRNHRHNSRIARATGCQFVTDMFRLWGHQHIYDQEELLFVTTSIGFVNSEWKSFGVSHVPHLSGLERHADTEWMKNAFVMILESEKPPTKSLSSSLEDSMIDNPLVSINLTTYNRAELLPRALDSVMAQTYHNFEVIVVDDCSLDNTAEVVSLYKKTDSRIRYLRHESNCGLAHARNTALNNSNGDFIAIMDDDDEWIDQQKLEKEIRVFQKESATMICCTSIRQYSSSQIFIDRTIDPPANLKEKILRGNGIIYTSTVMIRRSLFAEVGSYDEKMTKGVDSEFFRRCIVKYGYDVHFMADITTAVHEYGADRMTPVQSRSQTSRALSANLRILKKYWFHYVLFPSAAYVRLRHILRLTIRFVGADRTRK